MSLPLDKVLRLERQFRFQYESAQNAYVLLYPEGLIKLTGSAGEIMKRVDGSSNIEEIIANIELAFPGVDLKQDVIDFLEHAHDKAWIRTD